MRARVREESVINGPIDQMKTVATQISVPLPPVASSEFRVVPLSDGQTCAAFFAMVVPPGGAPPDYWTRHDVAACLREIARALEEDRLYPDGEKTRHDHVMAVVTQKGGG